MKILSFGHIPTWAGGHQSSGLANVIYQLAKNMSDCQGVDVCLAATDVSKPIIHDGKLSILGWSRGGLLRYVVSNPLRSLRWLYVVVRARIRYGREVSVLGYFFKGVHLSKCLFQIKPDVVHLHGIGACVYEYLVPRWIQVIVTMHGLIGMDKTIPNHSCIMKMERAVCISPKYLFIAFIAKRLIEDFTKLYHGIASKSLAIPNAYDSTSFYYVEPVKHDKLTLVTIASLSDNKGQHRVLEAIARSGISCKYICIGFGTEEMIKRNDRLAKQYGVEYEYVGRKTPCEIREYMALADYMILPSSTEGFGLVLLEAIACGVPVVLPEYLPIVKEEHIIKPGVNAVLLHGCDVDAIVEGLKRLGQYAFNHQCVADTIPDYTWKSVAQKYVNEIKKSI